MGAIIAAGPAILYGGLIAVGIGYTLQVIAQKDAIASHAAIIFSMEAVFAAIAGAWLLGEQLSTRGYIGCALMLAGMLFRWWAIHVLAEQHPGDGFAALAAPGLVDKQSLQLSRAVAPIHECGHAECGPRSVARNEHRHALRDEFVEVEHVAAVGRVEAQRVRITRAQHGLGQAALVIG